MKRTYTLTYKIPKGTASLTPQGLRGIYEESTGSKRDREFNVEILSDKAPDSTNTNDKLEQKLIESVECFFTKPDLEWLSDYYFEATRVRNLFLYNRDNTVLWGRIEQTVTDFIQGLANETLEVELGLLLPTIECVDESLKAKFAIFYDYFYWFNPLVKQIHGKSDLMEYFKEEYSRGYSQNPAIVNRIEEALLSLHNECLITRKPDVFGLWLRKACDVCGEAAVMDQLLQLITDWSTGKLTSESQDFQKWIQNFSLWRRDEVNLWNGIISDPNVQINVDSALKRLEALMLIKGLRLHAEQLTSILLDKSHIISEVADMVGRDSEAWPMFQEVCNGLVPRYYECMCELTLKPIVLAKLICDLSETTITGEIGEKQLFQPTWREFLVKNIVVAKPLSQLAAESMNNQNYEYVSKIARLLELDESGMGGEGPSQFLENFNDSLWAEVCELSCKKTGEGRTNRFTHGINILRTKVPLVGWQANVYLRLLNEQSAINEVYWHKDVKHQACEAETERITSEYKKKYPNRIIKWDLEHSYARVQLNDQVITCTFSAYKILDLLSKTPGYGVALSSLNTPKAILDTTLKELISGQYVVYVPSSKLRKFEDSDMIYLTYK